MQISTRKLVIALVFAAAALWAADDPLMGTWKVNVAKSKYSPGPPPKSGATTYAPYGKDGVTFTSDQVNAQGQSTHVTFVAEYDGKDYPVSGDPARDAISMKRIDAYTTETTSKKAGKVTTISRRLVAQDGKTMTLTTKGANAQGQPVDNVVLYDKQ